MRDLRPTRMPEGASQVELVVKDPSVNAGRRDRHGFNPWVGKISWKGAQQPISEFLGFPGSDGRQSACNVGELGSIPVLGRSPGEWNSYPLQSSGLENSVDRGLWQATVHGVTKSPTWLSNFHSCIAGRFFTI